MNISYMYPILFEIVFINIISTIFISQFKRNKPKKRTKFANKIQKYNLAFIKFCKINLNNERFALIYKKYFKLVKI